MNLTPCLEANNHVTNFTIKCILGTIPVIGIFVRMNKNGKLENKWHKDKNDGQINFIEEEKNNI